MTDEKNLLGWNEFAAGALLHPFEEDGNFSKDNSYTYHLGDWRVDKPIYNSDSCIHCQFCWVYCPDTSIISQEKKFDHIDYDHCKGCGICAQVCPTNPKSLIMFADQTEEAEAHSKWPTKEKKEK